MPSVIAKTKILRDAGLLMCLLIIALGAAVFVGWYLNIQVLKSVFPGLVTFKVNAAIEILLCGLALAILFREKIGTLSRFCTMILSVFIILLACCTLSEDLFGWELGIDQLLFQEVGGETGFTAPGRMSPSCSYCFLLIGIALLVGSQVVLPRLRLPIISALSTTVLIISGLVLLSFLLTFLFNISIWGNSEMAIHLALGFVLLGIALQVLIQSEFELKWYLDSLTTSMFVIGILVLLGAAAGANHLTNVLKQNTQSVTHSQETLKDISEIFNNMAVLENGQRGYIISGDEKLLEHSIQMKSELQTNIADLYKLTVDNSEQQLRINQLKPLVDQKIALGDQMMVARKQQGFAKAQQMMTNPTDVIVTDKIYNLLTEIQKEEFTLLGQRVEEARTSSGHTLLILPVQVFLSLTIFSFGLFWLNVGVAARKLVEEQLRQSQKMDAVGQLTGGVAHDFNNLLGVIIGNLDLLERLVVGNEAAIIRVKTIQKAALRGSDLTKRLLTFSRLRQLNPIAISLENSIQNMIEMASRVLGPEIKITTNFEKSLPFVFVDAAELENALLNLVVNARDAMPNGGMINISTHIFDVDVQDSLVQNKELKAGHYASVKIADSGNGMSKETLSKAFDPFFTTKLRGKGTGLGLSMVYGFVKQSGGAINIYSEMGHGTVISISLPLAEGHQLPKEDVVKIPLKIRAGSTVLVVDDEAELLEVAVVFLNEIGFRVLSAIDGPSALVILKNEPSVDLLVTDIIMPGGINGVELGVKALALKPDLKIIYSSGFPSDALPERSGTKIVGPLLNKPYQRKDLIEAIRVVMGEP